MAEVNLTAKNVLFVDDNPVERSSVQEVYPAIRVIGSNPFHTRRVLLNSPETQIRVLTNESVQRDQMIRSRRDREVQRKAVSREEFLQNLNCRVDLCRIDSSNDPAFSRTFELLNKTNQFNTNGKRWTLMEIEQHFERGGLIIAFNVKDRFTAYGLVGVMLISGFEIVQFAMSCRVLGLEVEVGALNSVVRVIGELAPSTPIVGTIVQTEANFVCRDVYTKSGFTDESNGRFVCTAGELGEAPSHLVLNWV